PRRRSRLPTPLVRDPPRRLDLGRGRPGQPGVQRGVDGPGREPTAGVGILVRYRASWLRSDLVAGLTVGAMLVPQSMAYAELAGVPAATGLYASLLAPVAYALVGTSRHL